MEEIILDEKKYISSKQAAKVTGYAKDYIGQLCREGRVQARLVGRSWYVLESAILDHRFGTDSAQGEIEEAISSKTVSSIDAWEAPRYMPLVHETLPVLTARDEDFPHMIEAAPLGFNEGIADSEPSSFREQQSFVEEEGIREEDTQAEQSVWHEDSSPLQTPEMVTIAQEEPVQAIPVRIRRRRQNRMLFVAIRLLLVLLGTGSAALALLNSGQIDEYIISDERVQQLAGVSTYKR